MFKNFSRELSALLHSVVLIFTVIRMNKGNVLPLTSTQIACSTGLIISRCKGLIFSPNFPRYYSNNLFCNWTIVAPEHSVTEIYFFQFDLEYAPRCVYDYLKIYLGTVVYTGAAYCGKLAPKGFSTSSDAISIIFRADNNNRKSGFLMGWKIKDSCGVGEFPCWDDSCIPLNKHCDHHFDCADNSDEIECSTQHSSHQSNETCGKQDAAPKFLWNARIIFGSKAAVGSWPWQAQLLKKSDGISFCGGSIVHRLIIMTAAHCVDNLNSSSQIGVAVGFNSTLTEAKERMLEVSRILLHPSFYSKLFSNDIALLLLKEPVIFAKFIHPICIPTKQNKSLEAEKATICVATGFGDRDPTDGRVYSDTLFQARMPLIDHTHCRKIYGNMKMVVTNSQICAGTGRSDSCQGDSGGPLVCLIAEQTWYQVGITSFGLTCADSEFPGVYTKVSQYSRWIQHVTSWSEACYSGVVFTKLQGTTSTPNYPQNYFHNSLCRYTVLSPSDGMVIDIRFHDFHLASPCQVDQGDYVEVYSDNDTVHVLCDNNSTRDFVREARNVTLVFKSDGSINDRGILFFWRVYPVGEIPLIQDTITLPIVGLSRHPSSAWTEKDNSCANFKLFHNYCLLMIFLFWWIDF